MVGRRYGSLREGRCWSHPTSLKARGVIVGAIS
jgi:hypothetical protein